MYYENRVGLMTMLASREFACCNEFFLAVVQASFVSFFLSNYSFYAHRHRRSVFTCKACLFFLPFFPLFFPLNNGMQYKPAQRKLWCSPAYFIAPDMLVWKYIRVSVVMSTLHSPLIFSLANLSFVLTQCINHSTWRKLYVLI